MFVLVRHAHAGDKQRWTGPDEQRPLSGRGQHEAAALAPLLAELGVRRLLTSPTRRCRETLLPVSVMLGLRLEPASALVKDGSVRDLLLLLASPVAASAVLCTHGEVLNALDAAWTAAGHSPGLVAAGLSGTPKGAAWVVQAYPGTGATARFIPPTSTDALSVPA